MKMEANLQRTFDAARSIHRARGFSLMEVLVALLILGIGLLGLASLQAQSYRFNHDAYVRSQSTILASELIDKMRLDPTADYSLANPAAVNCDVQANPAAFTDASPSMEVCRWLADIGARLPGGTGTVVPNALDPAFFDVTVRWADREIDNQAACNASPARTWDGGNNICLVSQAWTIRP